MTIDREDVDLLRRAGLLTGERHLNALRVLRDDGFWARWAGHALLALGLGHLLAGIVFFAAYNWFDLGKIAKFAAIEAGIVLTVIAAFWRGADSLAGAGALIAANILTGVLLAVIGQVYQTGADPWQLFALWALLALPWAVAARNAAHWLVWLVVAHVAAFLFVMERLVAPGIVHEVVAITGLALLPLVVLALREAAVRAGWSWIAARWTRLVPATVGLIALGLAALPFLFEVSTGTVPAVIAFAIAVAGVVHIYRRRLPDFAVLAFGIGCAMLYLICAGGRVLFAGIENGLDSPTPILLMLGLLILWVIAVIVGTAKLLRRLRHDMRGAA